MTDMASVRLFLGALRFFALAALGLAELAAAALILLARGAATGTVGLGLAGRERVDAGADHRRRGAHRQRDDVDDGAGDAAAQRKRSEGEENQAHGRFSSSIRLSFAEQYAASPRARFMVVSVMTEIREGNLTPAVERFVLHWGDMGSRWGMNRSVAQIHALLYVAERPLTAEDIAETLGIARSNVSNSLKELGAWKLIRRIPVMGDRRDHYEAETDLWEMLARIAQGRKEREIDPAAAAVRACVAAAEGDARVSPVARRRLEQLSNFLDDLDRWYGQMLQVPPPKLMALMRLGSRIVKLIPGRGPRGSDGS
jgi:DNA-binding transcriptional regulator GbsR (MarR family)